MYRMLSMSSFQDIDGVPRASGNCLQTRAVPGCEVFCRFLCRLAWLSLCFCTPLIRRSGRPLGPGGATQNNNGSVQMNSHFEQAGASAPGHTPARSVAAISRSSCFARITCIVSHAGYGHGVRADTLWATLGGRHDA